MANHREALTQEQIRDVQRHLLDVVDDFCASRGIPYYLHAGTLLGAVRHKGFIPWDDDIDIAMMRGDYERFCREFDEAETGPVALHALHTHDQYAYPWVKISDERTRIGRGAPLANPIGVNIDLFPLDGWPSGMRCIAHRFRLRLLFLPYMIAADIGNPARPPWRAFAIRLLRCPVARIVKLKALAVAIDRAAKSVPPESAALIGVTVFPRPQRVDRAAYGSPKSLTFEGRSYPGPADANQVLHNHYGDFMTPPPENARWSAIHAVDCYRVE